MPKTLTKRKPKTTKEVRQKPKASASFVSNKYKNFQLYPNEPVYAEGFGPEPKLVKFLTTEVPPTYTGIFSLLVAFSLVLLFGSTIIQPKPTNTTEVIQTANIQTIKTNQIVAGGAPLKWTKLIKQSDITNTSHLLKLPKESTNIQVQTLTQQQVANLQQQPIQQLTLAEKNQLALSKQNNNLFFASILDSLTNLGKYFTGALKDGVDKLTGNDKDKEDKEKPDKDGPRSAGEEKIEKTEDAVVVDLIEEVVVPPVVEAPAPVEAPVVEETPAEIPVEEVPLEFPVEETPLEIVEETTVVEEIPVVEQTSEIQDYVAVTYETPAPIITEQDTDTGKVVTVKGGTTECESILHQNSLLSNIANAPASLFNAAKDLFSNLFTYIQKYLFASLEDAVNLITGGSNDSFTEETPVVETPVTPEKSLDEQYQECLATHAQLTDILASTKIPEIYKVGQENKIKIKWSNENDKDVSFHAYDTNNNGKLDYIEWTVPHLSTQTFEIIFISKAWHLDNNKDLVEDIYDTVAMQDNIFATIPQNDYVRVTFNDILDNTKDITVHAKPEARNPKSETNSNDQNPNIKIYPVYTDSNGNQTEGSLVAEINNVNSENTYRAELTNLVTPTDTFDLKVVSDFDISASNFGIDFDYIVDPVAWLTGWAHRKKITVDQTNVDADLSNFPLLVKVTADADLAQALATGYDIRFTDSGGRSTLYYERESWTGGGGAAATGVFWVKVATIDDAVNTDIYMYYGKSDATDGQSPTNVWDSNFKAVYHLKEATGSNNADSTNNANTGTPTHSPVQADGQIDGSLTFDGANDYSDLGTSNTLSTPTNITISTWIKGGSWSGDDGIVTRMYTWPDATRSDFLLYHRKNVGIGFNVTPNGNTANVAGLFSTSDISSGVWHYIAAISDGTNLSIYIDGTISGTTPYVNGINFSGQPTYIGRQYGVNLSDMLNGSLDEVRISNSARSADWIKFEYNNQGNADNEIAFSTEEDNVVWLSGWNYRKKITIDHTKVGATTETQTNFPVLISLTGLSNINANGTDIRFTADDGGTYLAREIESYSAGTLTAWVKVPTLSYQYDTVIYMYYGNSTATEPAADSTYGSQNVWDSNFKAVYHLKETGTGATGDYQDSTSNNNDSTNTTNQPTVSASGKIASTQNFDGTNDNINVGTSITLNTPTAMTISSWINGNSWSGDDAIFTRMQEWPSTTKNDLLLFHRVGTGIGFIVTPDGNTDHTTYLTSLSDFSAGSWHYIVAKYDGTDLMVYIDGAFNNSISYAGGINFGGNPTYIGRQYNAFPTLDVFKGLIDETRLSNFARTAGWISTEYANQNSPGTFYSVEGESPSTGIVWTNGAGDNLWSTAGNWQGGVVPTTTDTAVFNSTATDNCTIDTTATIAGINIMSTYTGTISLGSNTLNVSGNFTNSVGTNAFNAGTGTVVLNGTAQIISGNTTFYNLTKTEGADDSSDETITFTAGTTQTITHTLTLDGRDDNDRINLRSSTDASTYTLAVTGATFAIDYVDVMDSIATGATIPASYTTDSGNNTGWFITTGRIKTWDSGSLVNNNCSTVANWDNDTLPTATDTVVINSTADAIIWDDACITPVSGVQTVAGLLIDTGFTGSVQVNTCFSAQCAIAFDTLAITNNLTINAGTLKHADNSTAEKYRLNMTVGGNFTLGASGAVNVAGLGYDVNSGPGVGIYPNGGSYGGIGGYKGTAITNNTYGLIAAPTNIGSAGSRTDANGGGAVRLIITGLATINGNIVASGKAGLGGGAGGSVYLTTGTITGSGNITANGGNGNSTYGGAGGGGRISLVLTGGDANFLGYSGSVTTYGGDNTNANEDGAAGTVYKQTTLQGEGGGELIIDNNNLSPYRGVVTAIITDDTWDTNDFDTLTLSNGGVVGVGSGRTLDLNGITINNDTGEQTEGIYLDGGTLTTPASYNLNYLLWINSTSTFNPATITTVQSTGTLRIDVPHTLSGSLTIQSGGNLTHEDNSTAETNKLNLTIGVNFQLDSGGTVNVNYLGYDVGYGPGKGLAVGDGGSYGGIGGFWASSTGITYGSFTAPTNLGSGGGTNAGVGGGAVLLTVTESSTINGIISANGKNDYNSGSGGSIYIITETILGTTGNITANGGNGSYGSGGGGRIALILTGNNADFSSYSGSITAYGGDGNRDAAAGTVYKQTTLQGTGGGDLIIDNNNLSPATGVVTEITSSVTDTTVGTVTLTTSKAGKLTIDAGQTLTTTKTGTTLTIGTGTTLVNNGTLIIAGSVSNSGTITPNSGSTFAYTGDTTAVVIPNLSYKTLTLSGAGKEYDFTAGATYTVDTAFNATGAEGSFLQLRSTSTGTRWNMAIPASRSFNYLDVKDSNNTGTEVDARGTTFTDSGNNLGWLFNQTPNAPTLVSPTNASYTNDTTPTLSANYSDNDSGDTGTTNYRISSSGLADCTANTNVIAWGTSDPATSDENENTSITISAGQALSSDATYYWCAQNNDGTVTSAWTTMGSFILDTTTPSTTATAGSYTFGTLSIPDVTVTLSCSDGSGSGCLTTYYCISENDTCTPNTVYTNPVSVGSTGYIRYYSTDSVSNNESISSKVVRIVSGGGGGLSTPTTSTSAESSGETKQPNIVEQIINIPQQIVENVVQQITNVFNPQTPPEEGVVLYPPIEQAVPEEAQVVFRGGILVPKIELEKIAILPLPDSVKELALKFAQFGQTLEKVGITKPEDIQKLQTANLIFPGLAEASGANANLAVSDFTTKEIAQIPAGFVFARVGGTGNIDLNTKVSISNLGEPIKTITTIQNKPLYLAVKPDNKAESVTGLVIFKSAGSRLSFFNYIQSLSVAAAASLMDATNVKEGTEKVEATKDLVLAEFAYEDKNNDGVWETEIQTPVVDGQYEIRTKINYQVIEGKQKKSENISMIMVVDPEGYVYEKNGVNETRIANANVSLYWQDPATNKYELWSAKNFQQDNPQITDATGKYSFLVPVGEYYIEVTSNDYLTYKSETFKVTEGSGVHMNIEMKSKNWFWRIFTVERILLGIIIILLIIVIIVFIKKRNLK